MFLPTLMQHTRTWANFWHQSRAMLLNVTISGNISDQCFDAIIIMDFNVKIFWLEIKYDYFDITQELIPAQEIPDIDS